MTTFPELREALSAEHTELPWVSMEKPDADPYEGTHWIRCHIGALGYWRGHKSYHDDCAWVLNKGDAELLTSAVNAAPAMLAHIDAQAAEIERLRKALRKIADDEDEGPRGLIAIARAALEQTK